MGRPRSFDESTVVAAATAAFTDRGYEATSVDDLLHATGLHRGSLYQAFGSKRGLFLAALRAQLPGPTGSGAGTPGTALWDLLLVAALELAPRDEQVRALLAHALTEHCAGQDAALLLGRRLLTRARTDLVRLPREDPAP